MVGQFWDVPKPELALETLRVIPPWVIYRPSRLYDGNV